MASHDYMLKKKISVNMTYYCYYCYLCCLQQIFVPVKGWKTCFIFSKSKHLYCTDSWAKHLALQTFILAET